MFILSLWGTTKDLLAFIFSDLLRTIIYGLASGIYQLIIWLYNIFERLCNSRILEAELLKNISERIGTILGIVMLFMVVFSTIQLMLEPDKLTDKEKGVGNIVRKILVVIIMFAFSNFAFQALYGIQKNILASNVIGKFILPYKLTEEAEANFGGVLSAQLFTTFYRFNEEDIGNDPNAMDSNQQACYYSIGELRNDIIEFNDFDIGKECLIERTDVINKKGNSTSVFMMNLGFIDTILLLGVGIGTLYFLFSYCITVGIRTVQLAFLEIVSPMAFVSYLSPKKDTMFQKWLKIYTSTYFDVFIRVAIINLSMFLIAVIFDSGVDLGFWSSVANEDGVVEDKFFIGTFMIMAILMFAKKAPDLLKELFPSGASKLSFGAIAPKKIFNDMLGGNFVESAAKMATGGAAIGIIGGGTSAISRFRTNWKNGNGLGKSLLGATGGLIGGVTRGVIAGGKKGNVLSNIPKGIKEQKGIDDKYDELVTSGGNIAGKLVSGFTAHFGETKAQEANRRIQDLSAMQGFYKNVKEQASEFSFIKAAQEQATYAQWDKDNETEQEFRNRKSALEKRVRDLRKASEQAASLGQDTFVFDGQTYSFVADADDNVRASRIKTILKESNVYATTHNVSRYDSTTNSWEKVVPNNAEDLRKMEIYATETEGYIKGNQKYARNVANDKAAGVNPNGSGKK